MSQDGSPTYGSGWGIGILKQLQRISVAAPSLNCALATSSAYYATSDEQRRRESEPLIDAKQCRSEWESFRGMLARGKADGDFDDVESFLLWYYGEGGRHAKYECMTPLLNIVTAQSAPRP